MDDIGLSILSLLLNYAPQFFLSNHWYILHKFFGEPLNTKRKRNTWHKKTTRLFEWFLVVRGGIEPPTQGFSVLCSTD